MVLLTLIHVAYYGYTLELATGRKSALLFSSTMPYDFTTNFLESFALIEAPKLPLWLIFSTTLEYWICPTRTSLHLMKMEKSWMNGHCESFTYTKQARKISALKVGGDNYAEAKLGIGR